MKENLPVSLQKLIHKVEEAFAEDPAMVELFIKHPGYNCEKDGGRHNPCYHR